MFLAAILLTMAAQGSITKIINPALTLYDENGQVLERVESKKLNSLPIAVEGPASRYGHLPIRYNGRIVYVRRADVQYREEGTIDCVKKAEAGGQGRKAVGEPGVKKGAGDEGKLCTP